MKDYMKHYLVALTFIAMLPTFLLGVYVRVIWGGFRTGWLSTERTVLWALRV